jgi:hypothetical protein
MSSSLSLPPATVFQMLMISLYWNLLPKNYPKTSLNLGRLIDLLVKPAINLNASSADANLWEIKSINSLQCYDFQLYEPKRATKSFSSK